MRRHYARSTFASRGQGSHLKQESEQCIRHLQVSGADAVADGDQGAEQEQEQAKEAPPLPEFSTERHLLLSHVRGVMNEEEYQLCLGAAQNAGACVTAFAREVMQRSKSNDVRHSGNVSDAQDLAITKLLEESRSRVELNDTSEKPS